jgi:hypothetical protein
MCCLGLLLKRKIYKSNLRGNARQSLVGVVLAGAFMVRGTEQGRQAPFTCMNEDRGRMGPCSCYFSFFS